MDKDKVNGLICEIDTAWNQAKMYLADVPAYPAAVIEANDWLATAILRAAQLNAELANQINTSVR